MIKEVLITKTHPDAKLPKKAYEEDAAWDLYSVEDVAIEPGESKTVAVGLRIGLPDGFAGFMYTRSGMGFKGLRVHQGLLDPDYTGDISPHVQNHGKTTYEIKKGDRVAQFIVMPVYRMPLTEVDMVPDTKRGEKGFGSTGR